jgi:hypothetical protein
VVAGKSKQLSSRARNFPRRGKLPARSALAFLAGPAREAGEEEEEEGGGLAEVTPLDN